MSTFRFTRLIDNKKERFDDLKQLMNNPKGIESETWLFVGAHDDDVCVGAGFWLQAAVQTGINVKVLIVTDGRMGYCAAEQEADIVEIRHRETLASFDILGISPAHIIFLGYPDNDLYIRQGRRKAMAGEPAIEGYTGLQNSFTYHLRKIRPQRVFVPADSDTHPDHKITYTELMISIWHATGVIWPELGQALEQDPMIYAAAIYDDFYRLPNLELQADQAALDKRMQSIVAYRSQAQIKGVTEEIQRLGPYEYLREVPFPRYSPSQYKSRFA